MLKFLIVEQLDAAAMELLDARTDVTYETILEPTDHLLANRIGEVDALTIRVFPLAPSVLKAARRLKVVSRHGVGYDNIPVSECTRLGIPVTIVGATNAVSVAEHTMFLMLAASKLSTAGLACARSGNFARRNEIRGVELKGKTLLIAGYGRIGRQVATRAAALGMRIVVFDPYITEHATSDVEVVEDLESGLRMADVVSLHLPLTRQTRHLLGSEELALLPERAIVVNASRGGVLCESSLLEAIESGAIHGAGLDVFEIEPLPASSPLVACDRIVLSPHSAALTQESLQAMGIATVQNALDAVDGRLDVDNVVNPEVLK